MRNVLHRIVIISWVCFCLESDASKLVNGDVTNGTATFSFNVSKLLIDSSGNTVFMFSNAAPAADAAKSYVISSLYSDQSAVTTPTFFPLAYSLVTLNGAQDTANPLYGNAIGSVVGLMQNFPLVSINGGTTLYWVPASIGSLKINVFSNTTAIKDAAGANCNGTSAIVGIEKKAVVAVRPNGGAFGAANSGLALIKYNDTAALLEQVGTTAIRLDPTTDVLKAGTNDVTVGTGISLHYDATLFRLYGGVDVTANAAAGSKAAAIFSGFLNNDETSVTLQKIAADAAVANNSGFATATAGGQVVVSFVSTMHTTTGLSYIVFSSGTAVYALPLVDLHVDPTKINWKTDTTHGSLAKKGTIPTVFYKTMVLPTGSQTYFGGRGFQTPATASGDLYDITIAADLAIMRAGGAVAPGTAILEMKVSGDVIFVTVSEGNSQRSGVFYSQALFDSNGVINGWTRWQRLALGQANAALTSMAYVPSVDSLFTLQANTNVRFTTWSDGALDGLSGGTTTDSGVGLVSLITNAFAANGGGVQGVFDFPSAMIVFNQNVGNEEGYQIYTGYQKCVIVKTMDKNGGFFRPAVGAFTSNAVADTAITFPGTNGITSITGSIISNLGAIKAATIAGRQANTTRFLLLGGTGGLAYANITTGGTLIALTGFSHVRALWVDENQLSNNVPYVYVLTNGTLSRLTYNGAGFTTTTLATLTGLSLPSYASFSDCVIFNDSALLGTSQGLFKSTGNLATATTVVAAGWQKVNLSDGYDMVTRITLSSTTTLESERRAQNNGGNVMILAAQVGKKRAAVFRFSMNSGGTGLALIPDERVILQGATAPYLYFDGYRNYFSADGAISFSSDAQELSTYAFIQRNTDSAERVAPKKIAFSVTKGASVGPLIRNSALGSSIIQGDFGVRVHE